MNKFVLKNSETRFQLAESSFQNAGTRFQNAKNALSRIFFARTWMDSAQKSLLMDWLNARIITSTDPFRMKTKENFAAFG